MRSIQNLILFPFRWITAPLRAANRLRSLSIYCVVFFIMLVHLLHTHTHIAICCFTLYKRKVYLHSARTRGRATKCYIIVLNRGNTINAIMNSNYLTINSIKSFLNWFILRLLKARSEFWKRFWIDIFKARIRNRYLFQKIRI